MLSCKMCSTFLFYLIQPQLILLVKGRALHATQWVNYRPVNTGDFCCDFRCDFLILMDGKE